jgi:hypothetical protein
MDSERIVVCRLYDGMGAGTVALKGAFTAACGMNAWNANWFTSLSDARELAVTEIASDSYQA